MSVRFNSERLVLGIALVALGILWTLSNLGRVELLTAMRTYWPSLLVVWGAADLFNVAVARSRRP